MNHANPYQAPGADVSAIPALGDYDQSNPFSPGGRFGRLSYIAWGVLAVIVAWLALWVLALVILQLGQEAPFAFFGPFSVILQLFIMIPMILFAIRRLHDFDASGWWSVLMIIPVANIILTMMLLLKPGTAGANRFAPPRITAGWERVLGFIGIIFMVVALLGVVAAIMIPMMTR